MTQKLLREAISASTSGKVFVYMSIPEAKKSLKSIDNKLYYRKKRIENLLKNSKSSKSAKIYNELLDVISDKI